MVSSESLVGWSLIRLQELPRRNGVEVTIQQKGDIFTPEDQTELSLHSMCVPENNSENLEAWGNRENYELHRIIWK